MVKSQAKTGATVASRSAAAAIRRVMSHPPVGSKAEPALRASSRRAADETTLPVLDPGRGKTKTGQLWCYAVDDRPWAGPTHPAVAYVYCDGRHGEHPIAHLSAFQGILQVDGYAGYGNLEVACAATVLRVLHLHPVTACSGSVARIAKLYQIEAEVRGHRRMCVGPSVRNEVGRWLRICSVGCRSTCRACLAGRTWKSHALCPGTLGWADQSSDNDYQEEQFIRRFRRWSPSLGDRQHIDPVLQTQRR